MIEKRITAIVPVLKGSVRVKNKNLKPFAGKTLLQIKIEQLKQVSSIDRIVVSSDCDEMLQLAASLGVSTHRRDEYYASSEATNSEFFEDLGRSIDGEYLMYSPVTCPLISLETYHDCIKTFKEDAEVTNLVTVSPDKHHIWLDGEPLNYDVENSPNSQDLPDIYAVTY